MKKLKKYKNWYLFTLGFAVLLSVLVQSGCESDFDRYYAKPADLEGAIYEQLAADPDFAEFVKAIDMLPVFKQSINTSGLYTCFAPVNEAVREYLQSIGKSSFTDFDMNNPDDVFAVQSFVDAHFMLDMYFVHTFNANIADEGQTFLDRFRYFSRHREPNFPFYDRRLRISRTVRPENKQLNVFMSKYLLKHEMSADYTRLYAREPGDFNVENAQVLPNKRDIAAVNGSIHGIDKVLTPRHSLARYQQAHNPLLARAREFNYYLSFNAAATASETRGEMDSLFTINPRINMSTHAENMLYTFFNPPRAEFENFVNNELFSFVPQGTLAENRMDSVHMVTRFFLSSYYIASAPVWANALDRGIPTLMGDTISNIRFSSMDLASNAIIYNLDELLLPSAFQSVARPMMLDPNYSWFYDLAMGHLGTTNLGGFSLGGSNLLYLQNLDREFTLLLPSNLAMNNDVLYHITRETMYNHDYRTHNYRRRGRTVSTVQMDSISYFMMIPQEITAEQLASANNMWVETRLGNYLQINNGQINGVQVTRSEKFENGTVHYFDARMMPVKPWGNITDVIWNMNENPRRYNENWENENEHLPQEWVNSDPKHEFDFFLTLMQNTLIEQDKEAALTNTAIGGNSGWALPSSINMTIGSYLGQPDASLTLFLPTNQAIREYALRPENSELTRSENFDGISYVVPNLTADATSAAGRHWARVIKYLITTTRVYSDGTYSKDIVAGNPTNETFPLNFISVHRELIHSNPISRDEWSHFEIDFNPVGSNPGMVIINPNNPEDRSNVIETWTVRGDMPRATYDIEVSNGVIHVIDRLLTPPRIHINSRED